MREILFKAKRIDNDEWVEGSYVYTFNEDKTCPVVGVMKENHWIIEKDGNIVLINKDTICQYTGLTDKNGNKIWENDVCNCIYDGRLSIRVIIWDKDELDFKGTNGKKNYGKEFDYLGCCEEIEVIGNIFDNPKLIGE